MKEPYGTTIFCDDIRDEVGNKKTYVGVYLSEMVLEGVFPVLIPTFGLSVKYLEPLDMKVEEVSIKVFIPGETEDAEVLVDVDLPADRDQYPAANREDPLAKFRAHLLNLRVSPLVLKAEGHIKVRAYVGKREKEIRLGTLRVRTATPEDVLNPPIVEHPLEFKKDT